ncbi:MAG: DUF2339 domain-containing protein [Vicinamibacterales bacterium]
MVTLTALAVVLAFVLVLHLRDMGRRLRELERRVDAIGRGLPPTPAPVPAAQPLVAAGVATPDVAPIPEPAAPLTTPEVPPAPEPATPAASTARPDFETAIGSRLMLVVGTVLVVLGVAFFVKYAFDNQWITETTRVAVGTLVGLALWWGGLRLVRAGYATYGRVLSGGGLAAVYITAFAAHALYGLVPQAVSFGWMVLVSAATAITADRQSSPGLALTAIVLAYLAPVLAGADGQHLGFFGFMLALSVVTLALTRRHGWPALGYASLYLAIAVTALWALRSFRPDVYASTEIYLTSTFAIFLLVLRAHTGREGMFARLAAPAAFLLTALYHAASLTVLRDHGVAFLAYLLLATMAAMAAAIVRASAWLRIVVWVAAVLPFSAWLATHAGAAWSTAALATGTGLYLLHLATQFLTLGDAAEASTAEVLLFQANGIALFLCWYDVAEATAGSTTLVATGLAAWNGVLAWMSRGRLAAGTAHASALAFAMAATAIALAFAGPWVTVAWAAEATAVIWMGLAMRRGFLRLGGVVLLALAVERLVREQFPVTLASHVPVFNLRVATAAFVIGMCYVLAARYRRDFAGGVREERYGTPGFLAAAHLLTVLLATAEISSFWELRRDRLDVEFARQLSISLGWAGYALGLITLGFGRGSSTLRYLALGLFGVTVTKMFTVDLLALEGIYRISGFVALGAMLLGASFLYQRATTRG